MKINKILAKRQPCFLYLYQGHNYFQGFLNKRNVGKIQVVKENIFNITLFLTIQHMCVQDEFIAVKNEVFYHSNILQLFICI